MSLVMNAVCALILIVSLTRPDTFARRFVRFSSFARVTPSVPCVSAPM
jgi:hypothetical protein